ncbi:2-octaprenyl-3-methyl-6-methoxy-1,4-benzoquinol hydroxylase [Shewanella sp. NFH-SH190041]|uniref:FAD-dependent monooxygenase n=1 Tax=Shewanella sp. NFH-SH190041 TaxID=2950245 RepID=UPI0021C451A8|nr:FAD-dependent monooxygenase [Shewanella sp. NFH-SH190041]BDM65639.1 2-octaprenyl-3-methyl-6-methoxy-1,4-benzoquinol hydroxylase [Shewanella sp. NFH-SH190041]
MLDMVVIGGGMVGAAAAVGLGQLGFKVAVVDACEPQAFAPEQALDLRVSAVSVASEQLLTQLGAWPTVQSMRSAPYLGLETWELAGFITRFHASDVNASHLGHIVENRLIQLALWQQLRTLKNVELYCPATVSEFSRPDADSISVQLDCGQQLQCRLLIGADGADSKVRDWAGIGLSGWQYSQSAMLINVNSPSQQSITWQQFTPSGPRALLPLPGDHVSLVWYDSPGRIAQLMQLSLPALAQQVREHFPARLTDELGDDFIVQARGSFPLTRRHAQCYTGSRLLLLGDAAHTINPLAGQGVNLGFKDVAALLRCAQFAQPSAEQTDKPTQASVAPWWQADVLQRQLLQPYQQARYRDNLLMMTAMDAFYLGFSNDLLPLKILRNGALKLADNAGVLKQQVLKYAMGLK